MDVKDLDRLAGAVADIGARGEISEVMVRYCEALDRRDVVLLRSCFHADSTHDHGGFVGPSMEFCDHAMALLAQLVATQHLLGNISIKVAGDTATASSYFQAYHRMPSHGAMVFPQARPDEDVFIGGRYLDRFERRDGAWKIARRNGILDWWRFEAAADRGQFGAEGGTGLASAGEAGGR